MGIDFAVEQLYATGWSTLESTGCISAADGRLIPSTMRVMQEFEQHGFQLTIRHIATFDCYRAEWQNANGQAVGAVVGQTQDEAAVYALAQMRRMVLSSTV